MTRKTPPANVSASVRARLLKLAKERREDFTLTLVNWWQGCELACSTGDSRTAII